MAKTLLLTAYDPAMAPIGDLTAPRMLEYANRHGFDFRCIRHFQEGRLPYWQKIDEMVRAFCVYDRVLWLDADQVITNPEFKPVWTTGFHTSMDWGTDAVDDSQFSACGIFACKDVRDIFESVHKREEKYDGVDFPEQTALRDYYHVGDCRYRMKTHPRRVFNAVPAELCPTAPEPWQPGDFCCHLTHVDVARRVEMFHQIVTRLQPTPEPTTEEPTPDDLLTSAPYSNDPSAHLPGE